MKKLLPFIFIAGLIILILGFTLVIVFLHQQPATEVKDDSNVQDQATTSTLPATTEVPAQPSQDPTSLALDNTIITNVPGPGVSPLQHQITFVPQDQIYITVKLSEEKIDTQLTAEMVYIEDKSKLGPVKATIKAGEGTAFAMFELTPPPTGWPRGEYLISIADLSEAAVKQVSIIVR